MKGRGNSRALVTLRDLTGLSPCGRECLISGESISMGDERGEGERLRERKREREEGRGRGRQRERDRG